MKIDLEEFDKMLFCIHKSPPLFNSTEDCKALFSNDTTSGYCPPVWDRYNCWPPTAPGSNVSMMCPPDLGNVLEIMAYRFCQMNGTWAEIGDTEKDNWSSYSGCTSSHVSKFRTRVSGPGPDPDEILFVKQDIAAWIRFLEIICLILSTILGSWTTFLQWRHKDLSLTKEVLHIRLFSSTTIHAGIKLYIYLDQTFARLYPECATLLDAGFLCQFAYAMAEFTKSLMISYMVCEGIHLQSLVDTTRFPKEVDIRVFDSMSFAFSILTVGPWAIISHNFTLSTAVCWFGYVYREEFWIVELPRIVIIVANGCFLVKVVVGVVRKLQATNAPPGEQVKKGTKAAVVLMFLFGVPHLISMIYTAAELNPIGFGIFSVVTTLFSASQGFCVAILYCREMILDSLKPIFKIFRCEFELGLCDCRSHSHRSTGGSRSGAEHVENKTQLHSIVELNERTQNNSSPSVNNSRRNLLETSTPSADIVNIVMGVSPSGMQCFTSPELIRPVHPIFEKLNNCEPTYSRNGSRDGDLNLSLDNVEVEHIEIPREYLAKDWKASEWKTRCGTSSSAFSKSLAFSHQKSPSSKVPSGNNHHHSTVRRSSSVGAPEPKLIPLSTSKSSGAQSSTKINEQSQPGSSSRNSRLTQSEQQVGPRLTPPLPTDSAITASEHFV